MKLKLLLSALCLTAASVASAAAPYLETSVGYLLDSEKAFVAGRVGFEVANTNKISHQLEFEVGHVYDSSYGVDLRLVPLLANYRVTAPMSPAVDFFGGAGLGATHTTISTPWGYSFSDNPFTWQVFTGLSFNVTSRFAVTTAVRYIDIGNFDIYGYQARVGDDLAIELGARFRF